MKRKTVFWILGVLVLITVLVSWKGNPEAGKWSALTTTRRKNVFARKLVAFDQFLNQRLGSQDVSYSGLYDGYSDNTAWLHGTLLNAGKNVGYISHKFYYQKWDAEPSSEEVHLMFKPDLVKNAPDHEWKSLLEKTLKDGEVRTTYGEVQWFSFRDDKGGVDLTLRIPYPSRWVQDIPEYDRGYFDTMFFDVSRKAMKYLFKEAFVDPYTRVEFLAPKVNPPTSIWTEPTGHVDAYIYPKDGSVLHMEIYTSYAPASGRTDLGIMIKSPNLTPWSEKQAQTLFKPEFYKRLKAVAPTKEATIFTEGEMMGGTYEVRISGNVDDFPKPDPR